MDYTSRVVNIFSIHDGENQEQETGSALDRLPRDHCLQLDLTAEPGIIAPRTERVIYMIVEDWTYVGMEPLVILLTSEVYQRIM